MRPGETSTRMKSVLLKFVVGAAALCGVATLLLSACALAGIGPAFDRLSAASLLLIAFGVLLARFRKVRAAGRLVTALGGFIGLAMLLSPDEMPRATSAALICYGAAALLLLARRYGLGQAAASLGFLPSLGSAIGHLLQTEVLFGRPAGLVLLATVLCGAALLGGTAH